MQSDSEIAKLKEVMASISLAYDILHEDDKVVDLVKQLTLDVEWLCGRLSQAWSVVEFYQAEIRENNL
jgi:hypothetical protein